MGLKRLGFAALAALFVASGAYAQTAAPAATDSGASAAPAASATAAKPKPKPKAKVDGAQAAKSKAKKLPFVTVTVKNGRSVGLVGLTATMAGSNGDPVKVTGALAAGKSTVAHIPHDKACLFDLHGDYADGASLDESGVELCKDKKINLVD